MFTLILLSEIGKKKLDLYRSTHHGQFVHLKLKKQQQSNKSVPCTTS